MNVTQPVVRARWRDIGPIADLVTETLAPSGLGAWLVPDERRRPTILAAVARIWIEHALLFGDAFVLPNGTAATVWFHRYRPIPPPARYADRLTEACGTHLDRFLQLDQALAARRPTEAHNHLAPLAAPGPTESGHAAAALAGAQQWMDTLGLPTYAEVFTDDDRKLLRRHAYTHRDAVPLDDHTTAHSMWRLSPLRNRRSSRNVRSPRAASAGPTTQQPVDPVGAALNHPIWPGWPRHPGQQARASARCPPACDQHGAPDDRLVIGRRSRICCRAHDVPEICTARRHRYRLPAASAIRRTA